MRFSVSPLGGQQRMALQVSAQTTGSRPFGPSSPGIITSNTIQIKNPTPSENAPCIRRRVAGRGPQKAMPHQKLLQTERPDTFSMQATTARCASASLPGCAHSPLGAVAVVHFQGPSSPPASGRKLRNRFWSGHAEARCASAYRSCIRQCLFDAPPCVGQYKCRSACRFSHWLFDKPSAINVRRHRFRDWL